MALSAAMLQAWPLPMGETAPTTERTEAGATTSPVPGRVVVPGLSTGGTTIPGGADVQAGQSAQGFVAGPLPPGSDGVSLRDVREELGDPALAGMATASATGAATARVSAAGGSLTEDEVIAVLRAAGAPEEWVPALVAISWCESRHSPYAVGDGGNSLGQYQLWTGWFAAAGYSASQAFDPLVNARVALYVRETRGRFGGGGGWSCAALVGVE